ncbi:MAG: dienelactone hydrolase family protein [Gammaproteobacteria bacterium]|nr:dienelactone hydrolase family protein [Gammaproteobacteria bacterium]
MQTPTLERLIIEPPCPATASVIWLHGLGADGHDFEPLVPELGLVERGVRFILPHAPSLPVTVNGGYVMPAWYDIRWPDLRRDADEAGIRASVAAVGDLIQTEIDRGVVPERIVLAGFSQGGAIVLHAGLTYPQRLGGIMALSTYLALPDALAAELQAANSATPIFMAHGTDDPIAPFAVAQASRDQLTALGCPVAFHSYHMPHSVCPDEVADIRAWLCKILG